MEVADFCAVMDILIDQDALVSAPLKSVSIEYLEQDVTCLNERVLNYVLFIDQLQPSYFACNGL